MNSCLYECTVMHHRFQPKEHRLQHDLFMFYLDLDELDAVAEKVLFFSRNRGNLYAFRDGDHEPAGEASLKQRVLEFLRRQGIDLGPQSRICLLTLPRVFGYLFNPISVYYCFDSAGQPVCAIAEVGNTFREMKLYVIGPNAVSADTFETRVPKHFYVSPFSSLELSFDFKLKVPAERLSLRVDDYDGDSKVLGSTLAGRQTALNNRNLAWFTLKYPAITLKVIFLIHWHALLLWLKGVPFHRKADQPALQRNVLRPHPTLKAQPKQTL
jgi:DUF1365 family protein